MVSTGHGQLQVLEALEQSRWNGELTDAIIRREQEADDMLGSIVRCLEEKGSQEDGDRVAAGGVDVAKFHFDKHSVLYFADSDATSKGVNSVRYRLAVPRVYIDMILKSYHDGVQGVHVGCDKLIYGINQKYYWPTMNRDAVIYVNSCHACQQFKLGRAIGRTQVGRVAELEWNELVVMDICGPLKQTTSGCVYILCIIEYASRFVRLIPMEDSTAKTTAMSFSDHWLCLFGPPVAINSDRGPAFISLLMKELCKHYDINRRLSCPYVPRSHGIVERVQLTVQRALGYYLDRYDNDWDIPLQAVAMAINSTPNKSTGMSPNLLMFAREVGKIVDGELGVPPHSRRSLKEQLRDLIVKTDVCRLMAKRCSEIQREKYRKTANRNVRERQFYVGQKVFLFIPKNRKGFSRAMSQVWHGPYTIVARVDELGYKIRMDQTGRELPMKIHAVRLKAAIVRGAWENPCVGDRGSDDVEKSVEEIDLPDDSFADDECVGVAVLPNANEDGNDEFYEIEHIVQGKYFEDGIRYLCKWRGYDRRHNSYEPYSNLNAKAREFIKRNKLRIIGKPSK